MLIFYKTPSTAFPLNPIALSQTALGNNHLDLCQRRNRASENCLLEPARGLPSWTRTFFPLSHILSHRHLSVSPGISPASMHCTGLFASCFKLGEHFFTTDSADEPLLPSHHTRMEEPCGAARPPSPFDALQPGHRWIWSRRTCSKGWTSQ